MALGKKVVASKTSTVKKDTKPVSIVEGEEFSMKLKLFVSLKDQIASLTASQKSLEGDIKSISLEEYKKKYHELKRNPESMLIQSEKGDKIMFMVVKKYTGSVDEERATELRKKYGETFVDENSEMIMNNNILNKYSEQLESLIMGADFMTDEEKDELFINKVTYTIKNDAINEAYTLGKGDVEGLIDDIVPVLMLKATK